MNPLRPLPQSLPASGASAAAAKPLHADSTAQKREHAANQFESMFVLQLVRGMTTTMDGKSVLGSGVESEMFNSLAEWQLAEHVAKSAHFGIAKSILNQVAPREPNGHETNSR
jgi:Rod binding domain-containing protein